VYMYKQSSEMLLFFAFCFQFLLGLWLIGFYAISC
jgi:hypothetical protein